MWGLPLSLPRLWLPRDRGIQLQAAQLQLGRYTPLEKGKFIRGIVECFWFSGFFCRTCPAHPKSASRLDCISVNLYIYIYIYWLYPNHPFLKDFPMNHPAIGVPHSRKLFFGSVNSRMADVKCTICGDRGHVASDCKQAAEQHKKAGSKNFWMP